MYITDLVSQLKNIMPVAGLGFVLGIFHLILRIVRYVCFDNRIIVFVTDVIFLVFSTLSSFMLLLAVNNGHIRFYLVIAEAVGFLSFYFVFSEMIFTAVKSLLSVICKILHPVTVPLGYVFRKLKKQAENVCKMLKNIKIN